MAMPLELAVGGDWTIHENGRDESPVLRQEKKRATEIRVKFNLSLAAPLARKFQTDVRARRASGGNDAAEAE